MSYNSANDEKVLQQNIIEVDIKVLAKILNKVLNFLKLLDLQLSTSRLNTEVVC